MKIEEFYDHSGLVDFYISRGIEFNDEKQYFRPVAFSYIAKLDDKFAGAVTVCTEGGDIILDEIAVVPEYENKGIGTVLYNTAIDRIRRQYGDKRIYLVAKNIDFFKHKGWSIIPREQSPDFSECFTCSDYKKTCFPEVMILEKRL